MALSLLLFSFSKRQNSTAIPADASGVAVAVTLKIGTSKNNPVFLLSGDLPDYTYCKFEDAYYFIDDIRSVHNDLYELSCSIDVMATYRNEIAATTAYIEYASNGSTDIVDNRIAPKAPTVNYGGTYDIGIRSNADHYNVSVVGVSGVETWQVSKYMLMTLLNNVSNWMVNVIPDTQDIPAAIVAGFRQLISQGSAMDCVRACRWIPWAMVAGSQGTIDLGTYRTSALGVTVGNDSRVTTQSVDIDIPFTRSGFLRLAPFSDVVLYLPFVGAVNITHPRFVSTARVNIQVSKDNTAGSIAYRVNVGGVCIGTYGADAGVDIPVGVSNVGAMSVVNGITGAAVAASYGNYMAAIGAAVGAAQPTPSSVGGIQGAAGAGLPTDISYALIEHAPSGTIGNMGSVLGLPMFDTRQISSLSGYIQTRGASVAGSIRGSLRDRINDIMDSGFFRE